MRKCLDIALVLENGYRSKNFGRTGHKIEMGQPGRESSSQTKSPFFTFLADRLTVELDRSESWKVGYNAVVFFLLRHPLIKKYLTTNFCSTSSMTGW
jgi:hypothetical protein